jgi:polar amino acid transport system substrate-binding protein
MDLNGSLRRLLIALFFLSPLPLHSETFTFAVGEWPPFIGSQSPEFGSHSKVVRNIFESAGHEVVFEFYPWQRSMELAKNGKVPATFSWARTDERAKNFFYSGNPIGLIEYVLFHRKDRFPGGLEALSFDRIKELNLKLVAVKNYWYQQDLEKTGIAAQYVITEEHAWTMLLHKRADIYIESTAVGTIQMKEFLGPEADLIAHTDPIHQVPLFILFSKNHPDGRRLLEIWERNVGNRPDSTTDSAIQ